MNDSEELASPNRRALFRRLVKPKPVELPESIYPRPPWAQDNQTFLALCNRCDQCIDACPQRVIRRSEESHPVLERLPVLSLDYGRCNFCSLCVDQCPTGALNKEDGRRIQAVARVSGHCQLALNQPCDFCVDACEEDAIRIEDQRVQIDEALCTGCGECSLDCYDKAITLHKRG